MEPRKLVMDQAGSAALSAGCGGDLQGGKARITQAFP